MSVVNHIITLVMFSAVTFYLAVFFNELCLVWSIWMEFWLNCRCSWV